MAEQAKCRGCGKLLNGTAYYLGGHAYHPKTNERCPINQYGGYVCSRNCDVQVCLDMQSSMPGAGRANFLDSPGRRKVQMNWGD